MLDSNGVYFHVGSRLRSTEASTSCHDVICIEISKDVATMSYMTREAFKINQKSMTGSNWAVCEYKKAGLIL